MKNKIIHLLILFQISFFSQLFSQNPEWLNYTFGNDVTSIADEENYLWIGTTGGFVRLEKTTNEIVFFNKTNSGLPLNKISKVTVDQNGNKWIGTWGGGLAKFDNQTWMVYNSLNSNLPEDEIIEVVVDKNNIKWIATENYLISFDGEN